MTRPASARVGIIGLGVMGGAIARRLLASGTAVVGYDIDERRLEALAEAGAQRAGSARDVAQRCRVVLLLLPSDAALEAAAWGPQGLAEAARRGLTVVEMSTLSIDAKEGLRDRLEPRGVAVLDCPVSGTGVQAETGDIVVYASGDEGAIDECFDVLAMISRRVIRVGRFGAGSQMKYLANLLVAIHVAAAAEVLALAIRAGFDPAFVVEALIAGAGTSRMLEVRGPMMAARRYRPASMALRLFEKDLDIIGAFAASHSAPVPVFATAVGLFKAASARGLGDLDTSVIHELLLGPATDGAR